MVDLLLGEYESIVFEWIEDLVNKKAPLDQVWQSIILFCLTQNGIKPKLYESLKHEIIQVDSDYNC